MVGVVIVGVIGGVVFMVVIGEVWVIKVDNKCIFFGLLFLVFDNLF